MISPHLKVVDVEPDGFGVVNDLASARARTRAELHVLHDRGRVLRVVHTVTGPTTEHREPLGDLAAAAADLRRRTGVDRVVLVDRDLLVAEAAAFAAVGPSDLDQPTVFRRSNEVFWSSPAVVTDPPPVPDVWGRLEAHLRGLGEDYRGLLAGYDGDTCAFTLVGRFVDGRLVHLTSLPSRAGSPEDLLAAAEPVAFALVAPLDVLRAVLTAPDLTAALAACAPQALLSRGLPT